VSLSAYNPVETKYCRVGVHPPKVFAAGSDALDVITHAVEARLAELRQHADLSKTAGGAFTPAGST
jgi:hypothetical protein